MKLGPALAHVASAEGITCVENIKGLNTSIIDYNNIPGCTYFNKDGHYFTEEHPY